MKIKKENGLTGPVLKVDLPNIFFNITRMGVINFQLL